MKQQERKVIGYKHYFREFVNSLSEGARRKIYRGIDMLVTQERVSEKFVKAIRDGVFELRAEWEGNIYRVFFCFDKGNIVILFNGFQKKTQKAPENEIRKAVQLKNEYYENKSGNV